MFTDDDIASAVAAGILSEETAAAFRSHVARRKGGPSPDEEPLRLITGFNDIFVVIACVLLLISVAWIGGAFVSWLGAVAVAAAAWILGEFFIRKRHMAMPAILLLLAFVGGIFTAGVLLLGKGTVSVAASSALAAAAAWLHWMRFQVPITVASGAAAVIGLAVALLYSLVPEAKSWTTTIFLAAGIGVFLLAMRWDSTDAVRQTRRSDVAFWLHLLAAPLLVHPVFAFLEVFNGQTTLGQAIAVIGMYVAIALVSLCINRRALMVSALGYVLYTFSALLNQYGVVSLGFAITALAIGSALLLLSAFWHHSRAFVLNCLPSALQNRLASG